jgi:hypothetical protein
MATSGTVSETSFPVQEFVDQAFRMCRLVPQQITSEHIQTALKLLFTYLSSLVNKNIPLWVIERTLLPIYQNVYTVPTPQGTVDVMNANLRQITRLSGTYTSSEGTAAFAFDGDLETACTEIAPAGNIAVEFDSATFATNFGIMPNATGTWDISIQISQDGVTWTTVYTDAAFAAVANEWQWFDIQGIPAVLFVRLKANNTTVLDVIEFVVANTPQAIPLAPINRDDYSNLPNRTFLGRPVQYQYEKKLSTAMNLWPVPSAQFVLYQVEAWLKRYPQDVGAMADDLEVPQSWYWAICCVLAYRCARSIKEVDPNRAMEIKEDMEEALNDAWSGQSDGSPVFLYPNISPYTR